MKRCPCCLQPIRESTPREKYVPTKQEWDQFALWRITGVTWREMSARLGMSIRGAWKRSKKLEAAFGKLPLGHRTRNDRRDAAADYNRILAMREDGASWREIGGVLGLKAGSASTYYHCNLKKRFAVPAVE